VLGRPSAPDNSRKGSGKSGQNSESTFYLNQILENGIISPAVSIPISWYWHQYVPYTRIERKDVLS
jgi:hypothetical protein